MSQQLSFLEAVSKFAKPFDIKAKVSSDPITQARSRFSSTADETIKAINEDKDKSFWHKKLGDGFVVMRCPRLS